ncbi:hypothetical protein Ga0609869_002351 [Rhodovulum iodosum]|uniref:Uncharacterized protein n=1 Tax=Rhodovulum iodosum TaxID=68291 RepID=A0ABV3XXG6_9RHOB|nr:hypothetical protein [Rhodovulum robiginosum]RSK35050.1 hypothetical protein EJA01_06525 [Rhodovulum robiginosum]
MDVVRVGAIWRADKKWALPGGLSYATGFIDGDQTLVDVLAPAPPQWHGLLGGQLLAERQVFLYSLLTPRLRVRRDRRQPLAYVQPAGQTADEAA